MHEKEQHKAHLGTGDGQDHGQLAKTQHMLLFFIIHSQFPLQVSISLQYQVKKRQHKNPDHIHETPVEP